MCSGSKTRDTCLLDIPQTAQSSAHHHNCHTLSTNVLYFSHGTEPKMAKAEKASVYVASGLVPISILALFPF